MKSIKAVKTTYLIGLLFWLSAIIYFFAANWGGMSHVSRVTLACMLIILFYGVSYGFAKWRPDLADVGAWIFWGGSIAYGAAVALIGQIYNSHADGYTFFLIWLIPSVLLAIVTRFPVFTVQSYVLFNLTIYTYFYPLDRWIERTSGEDTAITISILLVNAIIMFLYASRKPKLVAYLAAVWVQILAIEVTTDWSSRYLYSDETFSIIGILVYVLIALLYAGIYNQYLVKSENKVLVVIASLGAAILLISHFFMIASWISGLFVYLLGILLAIGLVAGGTVWVARLARQSSAENHWQHLLIKAVSIFLAVLLITSSVMSIFYLLNLYGAEWILLSALVLVPIGSRMENHQSILRYTLMLSGLAIGSVVLWDFSILVLVGYVILVAYVLWREREKSVYPFMLIAFLYGLGLTLFRLLPDLSVDYGLLILTVLALGLYFFLAGPFTQCWNLIAVLTVWFVLTFFSEHSVLYYLSNIIYIVFLLYKTYKTAESRKHWLEYAVFAYLIAYFGYKYYDLFWKLLHKSVTFALAGVVFFLVALYFDKRRLKEEAGQSGFILDGVRKWVPVVVLQLLIIGAIIMQKEMILRNGTEITLAVEPVDPRSLMQGDYVDLAYNISTYNTNQDAGRVYVLLHKDKEGISIIKSIHDKMEEAREQMDGDDDVIVRGDLSGGRITYGIESFFIEEGTGTWLEENAAYAKVKVGSNGDAILLELKGK